MEAVNVGVRLAQYASLLSLFGLAAFSTYAPRAAVFLPRRQLYSLLAGVGLVASISSLFVLAATMSGDVAAAADPSTLWTVISGTGAGWAWLVRVAALVLTIAILKRRGPWPSLLASGLALASLAWGGHAVADSGISGLGHLAADILHILAAGVWVGALVAFLHLIMRNGESVPDAAAALASFSGVGTIVVVILIGTGVINSLFLTPWRPLPELTTSPWGWVLLAKLGLFSAMLAMAAANRFVLTPRLRSAIADGQTGRLSDLKLSLLLETLLAFGVVGLVSVLGALSPPTAGG